MTLAVDFFCAQPRPRPSRTARSANGARRGCDLLPAKPLPDITNCTIRENVYMGCCGGGRIYWSLSRPITNSRSAGKLLLWVSAVGSTAMTPPRRSQWHIRKHFDHGHRSVGQGANLCEALPAITNYAQRNESEWGRGIFCRDSLQHHDSSFSGMTPITRGGWHQFLIQRE